MPARSKTDALRTLVLVVLILTSLGLLYGQFTTNAGPVKWTGKQRVYVAVVSNGHVIVNGLPVRANQPLARYQPWTFFGASWMSMLDDKYRLQGFSLVVPAWMFLILTAWYPLFWLIIRGTLKRRRRRRQGLCAKCGYDLRGNTSGLCPECGTPSASAGPQAQSQD